MGGVGRRLRTGQFLVVLEVLVAEPVDADESTGLGVTYSAVSSFPHDTSESLVERTDVLFVEGD
jgi:hypothetical protein